MGIVDGQQFFPDLLHSYSEHTASVVASGYSRLGDTKTAFGVRMDRGFILRDVFGSSVLFDRCALSFQQRRSKRSQPVVRAGADSPCDGDRVFGMRACQCVGQVSRGRAGSALGPRNYRYLYRETNSAVWRVSWPVV